MADPVVVASQATLSEVGRAATTPQPEPTGADFETIRQSLESDPAASGNDTFTAEHIDGYRHELERLDTQVAEMPGGAFRDRLLERLDGLQSRSSEIQDFLDRCQAGGEFSQEELLAMQIKTHRVVQTIEVMSKTVEHAVSGMKTVFQTNV